MSNYPKYPPIKAPITPERSAALKFMRDCEQAQRRDEESKIVPKTHNSRQANYEAHRIKFESYILDNFYCPKGRCQLDKNPDGTYKNVAYHKNDSLKFSQVEDLWQVYMLGLSRDLS